MFFWHYSSLSILTVQCTPFVLRFISLFHHVVLSACFAATRGRWGWLGGLEGGVQTLVFLKFEISNSFDLLLQGVSAGSLGRVGVVGGWVDFQNTKWVVGFGQVIS